MHPERMTQKDKELTNDLHYDEIKLPVDKEDFTKIEKKKKTTTTTLATMCLVRKTS